MLSAAIAVGTVSAKLFVLCHEERKAATQPGKNGRPNILNGVTNPGEPVPGKQNGAPGPPSIK